MPATQVTVYQKGSASVISDPSQIKSGDEVDFEEHGRMTCFLATPTRMMYTSADDTKAAVMTVDPRKLEIRGPETIGKIGFKDHEGYEKRTYHQSVPILREAFSLAHFILKQL